MKSQLLIIKNKMEVVVKRPSSFKDIQRFKEISKILNISFDESMLLSRVVNHSNTKELHEIVLRELEEHEQEQYLIDQGL